MFKKVLLSVGAAAAAISSFNFGYAEGPTTIDIHGGREAEAWTKLQGHTPKTPINLWYNPQNKDADDLSVINGIKAWNGITVFKVNYMGTTTTRASACDGHGPDGQSVLDWGVIPHAAVGILCWAAPGECDIRIDPYKLPDTTAAVYKTLITHEVGHCAGLGHSSVLTAMMYPYVSAETRITSDDVLGLRSLYWTRWY